MNPTAFYLSFVCVNPHSRKLWEDCYTLKPTTSLSHSDLNNGQNNQNQEFGVIEVCRYKIYDLRNFHFIFFDIIVLIQLLVCDQLIWLESASNQEPFQSLEAVLEGSEVSTIWWLHLYLCVAAWNRETPSFIIYREWWGQFVRRLFCGTMTSFDDNDRVKSYAVRWWLLLPAAAFFLLLQLGVQFVN